MKKQPILAAVVLGSLGVMAVASMAATPETGRPHFQARSAEDTAGAFLVQSVRFDGVYGAVLEDEKDSAGPLCLVVRLYEDGTSVQAEFFGEIKGCSRWLNRGNDRLMPGRWKLDGDELTVLESRGLVEGERRGKLSDQGWTTTPTVTVKDESGWKIEPAARAGHPPVTFRFVPLAFADGGAPGARNRSPFFEGIGTYARNLDYDRAGNLKGIKDECHIQAGDPDQDALSYTWTVSNGSAAGDGPRVIWTRELENGKVKPGEISVEVTDGKGGRVRISWASPGEIPGGWTLYRF